MHSIHSDLPTSDSLEHSLEVDIAGNRRARKYSRSEQLLRVLWSVGKWAIRLSPRPMFAWRRMVLRAFGAKVGQDAHIYSTTEIYMPWNVEIGPWAAIGEHAYIYSLGKVSIGAYAAIAYRSHICAGSHDFSDPTLPLTKPPVIIGEKVWIGTDAFIGPGVRIGAGALVGARAVVVRDVAPLDIVVGNPATVVGKRKLVGN